MSVQFLDHVELDGTSRVRFIGDPVDAQDAANRRWVLDEISQGITEAGALDIEGVQDVVGAMLTGTGITAAYDDATGTIALTVTDAPTVGGRTPAYLLARGNHTGTQSLDTTTDSASRVAMLPAERTKLEGIADGATANATNAYLLSRANHTGSQSADTIVDGETNRVFTVEDDTKLMGIATGATANETNEALRDRTTHTGTQPLSTITGHDKAAHDALNIDAATLGGEDAAAIRARASHTGTQSLDTTTDSATRLALTPAERTKLGGVEAGATANADDAVLLDRANHTGTQSADTLTNGTANKVFTAADQTKLAGVAEGATANSTDAALRDRATHTGVQPLSTITGHDKAAHDALSINAASVNGMTAADIQAAVTASIVDGAPGTLDTLNEIAAALGDNPAAITDLMTAVALRNRTVAATIGDGTATSFLVTHGLGSRDVTVQIYETGGSFNTVNTSIARTTTDAVTVSFANPPAAGAYRVVVQGRPDVA